MPVEPMFTVDSFTTTDDIDESLQDGLWLYIDCDETVMEAHKDGNLLVGCYISDYIIEEDLDYNLYKDDKTYIYDHFLQYVIDECL